MKFSEFRKTYLWMTKHYPDTCDMFAENMDEVIGSMEITHYEKKDGAIWKEVDHSVINITRKMYCNVVDAVPFFRNLGGTERLERGHTPFGDNVPVLVCSVNPDKTEMTERRFKFHKEGE